MKIYSLSCNGKIHKYFATQARARQALRDIANNRRYNMGVEILRETADEFHTILGWEEHSALWNIKELEVEE